MWTRDWASLPPPNLDLSPEDAAAVVGEVSAQAGPAVAARARAAWQAPAPASAWQAPAYLAQRGVAAPARGTAAVRGAAAVRGRKRKLRGAAAGGDGDDAGADALPYGAPLSAEEAARQRRRAGRFTGDAPAAAGAAAAGAARRARLAAALAAAGDGEAEIDWDALAIRGTSRALEKSYFRLTSAPDPATVRPEPVLRAALARLAARVAAREVNYFYANDQFKGLRQDCVVQRLRGALAVDVYAAHARAALEYGDAAEFNQCQGQLAALVAAGAPGARAPEHLAHRLLYQAAHAAGGDRGEGLGLLRTLREAAAGGAAAAPEVAHALRCRRALAAADWPAFFRLYAEAPAPGLGRALLDLAAPRARFGALAAAVKAFKPGAPVAFLAETLGFTPRASAGGDARGEGDAGGGGGQGSGFAGDEDARGGGTAGAGATVPLPGLSAPTFAGRHAAAADAEAGLAACLAWLEECGAVVAGAGADAVVDCKASAGRLRMPEERGAVAHGDANLALGDFLKAFDGEEGA